eukprot:7366356-Pyramimonas_sp.AAC.1
MALQAALALRQTRTGEAALERRQLLGLVVAVRGRAGGDLAQASRAHLRGSRAAVRRRAAAELYGA